MSWPGEVSTPPRIVTQPSSRILAAGGSISLRVSASGTLPIDYQWHFNGLPLADATNTLLTITNIQYAHSGAYHAVVTNSAGSIISQTAQVDVYVRAGIFDIADPGFDSGLALPSGSAVPRGFHPGLYVYKFFQTNGNATVQQVVTNMVRPNGICSLRRSFSPFQWIQLR